jgi:hypothetical protein
MCGEKTKDLNVRPQNIAPENCSTLGGLVPGKPRHRAGWKRRKNHAKRKQVTSKKEKKRCGMSGELPKKHQREKKETPTNCSIISKNLRPSFLSRSSATVRIEVGPKRVALASYYTIPYYGSGRGNKARWKLKVRWNDMR